MAGSELLVLNPGRRRRGRRTKARKNRRRRRHAVARHNPTRHHRRRRRNPGRRRRSVARRNPSMLAGVNLGQITAFTVGGVVTEVLADKLAGVLPASWKSNADVLRIGTKAAIGIGVPLVARKFLPRGWGNALAIGGGVVTLLDVIKTYVAPHIPGLTMSGYEIGPTGLSTAQIAPGGGLSNYVQVAPGSGLSGSAYEDTVYGPIV